MRHALTLSVAPATFRVGSAWHAPIAALADLYADYPRAAAVPDFTVRLAPTRPWRRRVRPSVAIGGDYTLPEAAPLPLAQALLATEMTMNLQMALGWWRHLLLHAAVIEKSGRALILTGESGSGKSMLAALWEAGMVRRALAPLGVPVVLLKGTAFVAAGRGLGVGQARLL